MTDLPPKIAALVARAREKGDPSDADRQRVWSAIAVAIRDGGSIAPPHGGGGTHGAPGTGAAGSTAAAGAGAKATLAKLAVGVVLAGAVGAGALVYMAPVASPTAAPSSAPAQAIPAAPPDARTAPTEAPTVPAPSVPTVGVPEPSAQSPVPGAATLPTAARPAPSSTVPVSAKGTAASSVPRVAGARAPSTTARTPAAAATRHHASEPATSNESETPAPVAIETTGSASLASDVVAEKPPVESPSSPAAPRASPPRATVAGASEELRLIRGAQAALRDGSPARALAFLDEHAARFGPRAILGEEQAGLRVLALCASGRLDEGRRERERFLARTPDSPMAARVRGACAEPHE